MNKTKLSKKELKGIIIINNTELTGKELEELYNYSEKKNRLHVYVYLDNYNKRKFAHNNICWDENNKTYLLSIFKINLKIHQQNVIDIITMEEIEEKYLSIINE